MKIDFLDDLLALIRSTGITPEQYMIEHSLFFDNSVVDDAFKELLTMYSKHQPIPVHRRLSCPTVRPASLSPFSY